MYIVGLTGGIGSGKSEATKQFASLGVPIVDTDVIAHALTATGQPILAQIAALFGADFLNADGSLHRAKLRAHILADAQERLKLEALLHPAIYAQAVALLEMHEKTLAPLYQVLVVPLLFENQRYQSLIQKSIVIDCEESLQIERAMARSGLSELEAKALIQAQISRQERLKLADEVLENNHSKAELAEKVNKLHKKLIKTCIVSQ